MSEESQWTRVARLDDMREGEGYDSGVEVSGNYVGLFLVDGVLYAVGECTHEKGPICQGHREGLVVSCPWHSARFNIASGECIQGPVACRTDGSVQVGEFEEAGKIERLACYEVKVENDEIWVRPRA